MTFSTGGAVSNAVKKGCFDRNLLLLQCGTYHQVIRWVPPLIVDENQIHTALEIFEKKPLRDYVRTEFNDTFISNQRYFDARRSTELCASCHGTEGRGDGPAAASLTYKSGLPARPRDFRGDRAQRGQFRRGTRHGANRAPTRPTVGAATEEAAKIEQSKIDEGGLQQTRYRDFARSIAGRGLLRQDRGRLLSEAASAEAKGNEHIQSHIDDLDVAIKAVRTDGIAKLFKM